MPLSPLFPRKTPHKRVWSLCSSWVACVTLGHVLVLALSKACGNTCMGRERYTPSVESIFLWEEKWFGKYIFLDILHEKKVNENFVRNLGSRANVICWASVWNSLEAGGTRRHLW